MKIIKSKVYLFALFLIISLSSNSFSQNIESQAISSMHSISSNDLYSYVAELTSDQYEGRLTGTRGYNESAEWLVDQFKTAGMKPLGDNGSFYQDFNNPYTLIFPDCELVLNIKKGNKTIKKYYKYESEFIPGSTTGSGTVTAEVIYAGYGITSSELGYDDYAGIDVKGKIVLIEREVPVSPSKNPELFKKWRDYSFHQYKLQNAFKHGAVGMLYNYGPIGNPNNDFIEKFIYTHVGDSVVNDLFAGLNISHGEVIKQIKNTLAPNSMSTNKIVTIKNISEHHPEGIGKNIIGYFEGSDPVLKNEFIIVGAHLDHLGKCYEIIPGANDNASGVAVMLGIAKAIGQSNLEFKRSILFIAFGAEEQAVAGSKFYLENPVVPFEKSVCLLNFDGVGVGNSITAISAKNFPNFWDIVKTSNDKFIHRKVVPTTFLNNARPRLDAARFLWKGIPTISFSTFGVKTGPVYHTTKDNISIITPEIMEDLAQLVFLSVTNMANQQNLNFRNN